jgi:RHS repeat-associated protein
MTRPNSVSALYAYDNLSRLTSVLHQLSGSTIDGAAYTVDNAGNRSAKTDELAGVTSNYSYDAIYELTKVMQGTNTTESYTFDPVGNRLSSLSVSPYNYNTSNELTSTPSTTYSYDNNGNTLTKTDSTGTTNYTWDYENRLTQVTLPGTGGTVTFKYDPLGRRIFKSSSNGTSVYAYDGDNLIEETNSSGAAVARYAQTGNIDETLAMLRSGAASYYHADGLGSVTSLSSAAGSIANTYTYDSFGKLTASTGSLVNPFRYTGRESDTETGLYYYRARYYDPTAGRFLSEDPAGFTAGTDFYVYVGNNSTNLVDPKGLLQVCCRPAHQFIFQTWAAISLQPPPCHCFLKSADGHTLGGYFDLRSGGNVVLRQDDKTDHDKYAKEAKCKDIAGNSCENDARAKNAFGSAPKTLGGYGLGASDFGTSNDAAAMLLKDAGFNVTLPLCAWGKNAGYSPWGPGTVFPSGPPLFFKTY